MKSSKGAMPFNLTACWSDEAMPNERGRLGQYRHYPGTVKVGGEPTEATKYILSHSGIGQCSTILTST
jgi:hypothetical protein